MAARTRLIASGGSGSRETAKPRRDARAAAQSPSGSATRKIPPATSAPGIESRPGTTKPTPSAPPRLRANIPFSLLFSSRLRDFARTPSRVPAKAGTQSQAEQRPMASGTLGSRLRGSTGLVPQGCRVRRSTRKSERQHIITLVPQLDPGLRANVPFSSSSCFPTSRLRGFARPPSRVPAEAGTQSQAEQRLIASGTLGSRLRGSTGLVSQGFRVRKCARRSDRQRAISLVPQLDPSPRRDTSARTITPHHPSASSAPSRATPSPGASV